jgi:ABC transporter with metal-binding/Fe-S-binding domain ATP-binding protein
MRLAALISGGKDSALALNRVIEEGHQVAYLVSLIPNRKDSWMFHYPNIHLTALFAEASELPYIEHATTGVKEKEIEDLYNILGRLDIEGVVSGAIASEYQKSRIEKVCKRLDLESITPLWQQEESMLLEELMQKRFKIVIVGVYAYGFTEDWLGKQLDPSTITALTNLSQKYHLSLVGEGGEYESLVLDAPFFKQRIEIIKTETVWEKQGGYLQVNQAQLVRKETNLLQDLRDP